MYSDYIKKGGIGIFKLLSDNQTLNYLLSDDIAVLDSAFLFENGLKEFTLPVENMLKNTNDLTPIANMLKVRYGEKWKALYNTIPKSSDTLAGHVTKVTGSVDRNQQSTNSVAGYDSEAMVDDNSNKSTGSNKTSRTITKTNYLELTNLLSELKNNVFYDIIITDIRSYIFITIYGNERA